MWKKTCSSPSVYRSQRQLCLIHFFLPPLPEFPGIKLRLPGLCKKCLFPKNQLTSPARPPFKHCNARHTEYSLTNYY